LPSGFVVTYLTEYFLTGERETNMQANIEALLLDMDGVLWRDTEPIGNLPALFEKIESRNWKTAFVTNNATRSPGQYVKKLASFGVQANKAQIINSGLATALYLKKQYPTGGPVYIIGEEGLIDTLDQFGFYQSDQEPLAVISSLDRRLEYKKLELATAFIRSGVTFIGTNPDPSLPTPRGYIPGSGSILAALETASGKKPLIIGKPMPTMFQIALNNLQIRPANALVVGDQMGTDIAAGIEAGCLTALVLSGVSDKATLDTYPFRPTFIAPDFTHLIDQLI
jgi:4-nitrophenyl phosphatase